MPLIDGVPTAQHETLTVSTAAVTLPANLYGPSNSGGVLFQVLTGSINYSFQFNCTPTTTDFIASAGDFVAVRPARAFSMVRNGGTNALVKAQGYE